MEEEIPPINPILQQGFFPQYQRKGITWMQFNAFGQLAFAVKNKYNLLESHIEFYRSKPVDRTNFYACVRYIKNKLNRNVMNLNINYKLLCYIYIIDIDICISIKRVCAGTFPVGNPEIPKDRSPFGSQGFTKSR